MKKYRIQNCLELVKRIRENLSQLKHVNSLEERLRVLSRAKFDAELIYNTMRSLHD